MSSTALDRFRAEVNLNLACGALADVGLPVTGDDGGFPVVVALDDERLSVVLGRLRAVGGNANLIVRGETVRMVSVVTDACAIAPPDDDMTGDESPGADATVGMFLDYVRRHPGGVALPAALGHAVRARDSRVVEFASL